MGGRILRRRGASVQRVRRRGLWSARRRGRCWQDVSGGLHRRAIAKTSAHYRSRQRQIGALENKLYPVCRPTEHTWIEACQLACRTTHIDAGLTRCPAAPVQRSSVAPHRFPGGQGTAPRLLTHRFRGAELISRQGYSLQSRTRASVRPPEID